MDLFRNKKRLTAIAISILSIFHAGHGVLSSTKIDAGELDSSYALSTAEGLSFISRRSGENLSIGDIQDLKVVLNSQNSEEVEKDAGEWMKDGSAEREAPKRFFVRKHTIRRGETVGAIARKYGVNVETILSFNNIKPSRLRPGAELEIPNLDGARVKLRRGESPYDLSRRYEIKLSEIIEVNGITDPRGLKAGQSLFLPGAKPFSVLDRSRARNAVKLSKLERSLWPLPSGRLSSRYGFRKHPILHRVIFHTGVDIAAPRGSKIVAFRDGVVIHSGIRGGYGYSVDIQHKDGVVTRYSHNSKNLVKIGSKVKAGQPIALVGSTGNSTGPHLHFEVRKGGRRINPLDYL